MLLTLLRDCDSPCNLHWNRVSEMPDENICTDVKSILDRLENNGLQNYIVRSQEYQKLLNALGKDAVLSVSETDKLLAICARDLKEELRYAATLMNIISIIVTRVQVINSHLLILLFVLLM